jgi:hypothetical protein
MIKTDHNNVFSRKTLTVSPKIGKNDKMVLYKVGFQEKGYFPPENSEYSIGLEGKR